MSSRKDLSIGAFTLAEVLITIGIIGVVAAVTMPTLVTNIQERVRKEQVRTVKYKLTKATDKMKSLGKIGPYNAPTTKNFVNELKKHMTIAKVCDSGNLSECWSSDTVNIHTAKNDLTPTSINTLRKGRELKALAIGSGEENTIGIVTGDGVPMLLVYSPKCQALDELKTYTWSVDDGKPVTNATTNCISAIFDINGAKGPNKVGQDIRTFNSLFGSVEISPTGLTESECKAIRSKYGIKKCGGVTSDRWAAGIKECGEMGLHLPDMMTLANIANAQYGSTLIGPYTLYLDLINLTNGECENWVRTHMGSVYINDADKIICSENIFSDPSAGFSLTGYYWSNSEFSEFFADYRIFEDNSSRWGRYALNRGYAYIKVMCVGD